MCAFQLFLTVDPSLGRVDCSLLSDQTLMELLFEGVDEETKKRYQDNDGIYLDVCEWSCIKCDDHERVIEIRADNCDISGFIQLSYVPPKVKVLNISSLFIDGKLTGSVDLAHLPKQMKELDIYGNQFTGEIDLTHLPDGMNCLYLQNNQLTGEVDLTHLPDGIEILALDNNKLSGEIDLTQLPGKMEYLHFHNNQLSGSLVLKKLPSEMRSINAEDNNFNAVAVVYSTVNVTIKLRGSGVASVVDENGKKRNSKQFFK